MKALVRVELIAGNGSMVGTATSTSHEALEEVAVEALRSWFTDVCTEAVNRRGGSGPPLELRVRVT